MGRVCLPLALALAACADEGDPDGPQLPPSVGDWVEGHGLGRLYYVPPAGPGEFVMGCVAGRDDMVGECFADESPPHEVVLTKGQWVMEREVTQGAWTSGGFTNPSGHAWCGDDCPVENVTWWEALAFANAASSSNGLVPCYELSGCADDVGAGLTCTDVMVVSGTPYDCEGYRLPTEAEWEWFGRGGDGTLGGFAYSGGHDAEALGWINSNAEGRTHPACEKTPNAFELCDVTGNVLEWVWDWTEPFSANLATDPVGPARGSVRGTRGGAWVHPEWFARAAFRGRDLPSFRSGAGGFRLVRTAR